MTALTHKDAGRQKAGGAAALYIALALLAAMPYFLLVVDYLSAQTPAEKVALVVGNYASMYAMYLVTYVFYGLALGVLAFALYDRMQAHAHATIRTATAVGLVWAVALIASGLVFNHGMTTVVTLSRTDPAQARQAWLAIEPVAQALGGAGGEILGGLWILLVSIVALRSGALPKPLSWFGAFIGVAGLASVVPPLRDAAILFGMMSIVWFAWVGVALLKTRSAAAPAEQPSSIPAGRAWAREAAV